MNLKTIRFDFGLVHFHTNYLCLEVDESEHFTPEMLDKIIMHKEKIHPHKKIAYLSNRIHSFSFDPTLLLEKATEIQSHFTKLAIVSNRQWDSMEAEYLDKMCPIPNNLFSSISEALAWLVTEQ